MDDMMLDEFVKRDGETGYKALNKMFTALTGLKLRVKTAKAQSLLVGAGGRSIWLDVEAEVEHGRILNLEMQRATGKVIPKRALLHLSTIVSNKVHKGDSFEEVPEVWVIFVTEHNSVGDKEAIHHYQFRDKDGALLGDPAHLVIANGKHYDTSTLLGRVLHDIMTADLQAMLVPEIQQVCMYLKETEKGQRKMTEALERFGDERELKGKREGRREGELKGRQESTETFVRNMTAAGFPFDHIVYMC